MLGAGHRSSGESLSKIPAAKGHGLSQSKMGLVSAKIRVKPNASWTAAGSAAPRRFRTRPARRNFQAHPLLESAVAAAALPAQSKTLVRMSLASECAKRPGLRWPSTAFPRGKASRAKLIFADEN